MEKIDVIYISSSCLRFRKVKDCVEELIRNGYFHIELSGGTEYYKGYEEDLLELKEKYNVCYRLHNYFPPPAENFVLNMASLNESVYQKTLEHYVKAIRLCKKLRSEKYGLHAGFYIDFNTVEIGKNISKKHLYDKKKAIKRFCEGFRYLQDRADGVELYIENNVLSHQNIRTFQGENPLMLTDYAGYEDLKSFIDFKLLLDVAHLKVSVCSLSLDFSQQLNKMLPISDYLHLSENNGLEDQNLCFMPNSDLLNILKKYDLRNRTITIETYGSLADIERSYSIIQKSLFLE